MIEHFLTIMKNKGKGPDIVPRELDGYRENIERLADFGEVLTRKDICEITKLSRHGVANAFPYEGKYISKSNFARALARMGVIEGK